MYPVVILGLGVSGLGCGIELARRKIPFIAFEKEDRAGGLARSDAAGGFLFDRGPHILLGVPAELEDLFRNLDLDLAECSGRSGIALGTRLERVVPAPFQQHLSHLPIATRARLLLGMLRNTGAREPATYAEYAEARCGRGVYHLFLRGYDSKRLRFPLENMPANWTNRIEPTRLRSLIALRRAAASSNGNGHRESRFLYPRAGGIEALPRALARLLPPGSTRFDCEAVEIRPEAKLAVFASGESVPYRCLVPTLPLPEIVAAIRNPPPKVRRAAEDLLFTSIYILNAGIDGPIPCWSLLRFPGAALGFYRLSFPSQYSAGCAPPGQGAVVGEISHHATRYPLSPAEAKHRFRSGLERLGVLQPGQPTVFESIRNIHYGHVLYNQRTQAGVSLILEYLRKHSIFPCGKYGLWQDLLIPQSILSGMQAARESMARL